MKQTAQLAGESAERPGTVWHLTAKPLAPLPSLASDLETDVVVVGGGFLGLNAAIRLRELGKAVVVIDAAEPGWGASGRNNGQVIPGFKWDPKELIEHLGADAGERLAAFGGSAPDFVFNLIEKHDIACHPVRNGWIQPAYTAIGVQKIEQRCAQWAARGAPVRMLEPATLPQLLGTAIFRAGWIDPRGGSINPLAYARGLADVAVKLGARIFINTAALDLKREDSDWLVTCSGGRTVRAQQVVVATAAYADDLVPGLKRAMVPVRTAQVATAPLPEKQLETILPGRQCASDTRRLLTSFRISPDNRLVMGGSGATATLNHASIVPRLHKAAAEMFGHLGPLDWEFAWSGYFAVTHDHIPHIHETADGVICALGCNGRGIAVSSAIGALLADRLQGKPVGDMPLEPTPMKSFAFHAFRHLGVAVATRYHGLRDRIDARSR